MTRMSNADYMILRIEVKWLTNIGLILPNVKEDLINEIDKLEFADKCGNLSAFSIDDKYNELEEKINSYEP